MKKFILIIVLFSTTLFFAQSKMTSSKNYPKNYFINPLGIEMILSGTFAELRDNHFHAGIDIKTQQKEGFDVYASAEGYVSRIKISPWGYGKALYITHPNGYTTVYAHLKKFSPQIEKYIKNKQYKKESFEIQVFPKNNELTVEKGEIIAYSGSTGGFVGPHLHFEIRNTKTEKPINPFLFGFSVSDSKKPQINTLVAYSFGENSHINKISEPNQLAFKRLKNGDYLASKITAFGSIGFGINTFDQLDKAINKNGIYSLSLSVNGNVIHRFNAETFSFYESKYLNLLIDYKRYKKIKQRIHKCFVDDANILDMYDVNIKNGKINIEDGLSYNVNIVITDFEGNKRKISIPIVGKKENDIVKKNMQKTEYKINKSEFIKFSKGNISVSFPKNTFYKDFYLDFKVNDSIVNIHTPTIPLNKNYTLTFDISKYSKEDRKQLYIANISKGNKSDYVKTVKKENTFYTSTKKLGKFVLLKDNINPKIRLNNVKDGQWLTHFKTLQVKISDAESGIKSYRGEIDGNWILMEYDVKRSMLTYNFSDKKYINSKHNLKVVVTDNVGNSSTLNATFYRKI